MRVGQPQQGQQNVQPMMEQALAIQEMENTGDPHVDLLQRVINQLDNLSINLVQGGRVHQPQAMQHQELWANLMALPKGCKGENNFAITMVRTGMVCTFAPIQEGILGMANVENQEGILHHQPFSSTTTYAGPITPSNDSTSDFEATTTYCSNSSPPKSG